MELTVLIWVAIAIFWSMKAASEQKKRSQQQARPADETDERVAPHPEPRPAPRKVRPAQRPAAQEGQYSQQTTGTPRFSGASVSGPVQMPPAAEKTQRPAAEGKPAAAVAPQHSAATDQPLDEPFDLRQAVIYSEILKPKFDRFR